jgi:lysophospholipase L1-like esterase
VTDYRRTRLALIGFSVFAAACGSGSTPNPVSPTADPVTASVVVEAQEGACSFDGSPACFSPGLEQGILVGAQSLTSAPISLKASVSGTSVTFTWTKPTSGTPTSYVIEAGSSSGKTDIAVINTGNTNTSYKASNLSAKKYYVRVRGRDSSGNGPASNEVSFTIGSSSGGSCTSVPGPPRNLTGSADGTKLTLKWSAPSTGCAPTGYLVQAGSSSGSSNIAQISLGLVTTFVANAPSGTLYLRVRARNGAGTGSASNEVKVVIGGSGGSSGGSGDKLKITTFMAFGDSLTEGFTSLSAPNFLLVPAFLSFPTGLDGLLESAYPSQNFTVANYGKGGTHCNSSSERSRLSSALGLKPGALLLMHCANDLQVGESGSDISNAISGLSKLVDIAKSKGIPVLLASNPGQDKDGFREKAYEYMPGYASAVKILASSKGVTYVNVYGAIPNNSSLIGDDGLHLTSSGYKKVAQTFFNAIASKFEALSALEAADEMSPDLSGWEILSQTETEDY